MKRTMMCGEVRAEHVGQAVILQGWVHTVRDHGGLVFVDLRDRAGLVQGIVNPTTAPDAFAQASTLRDEDVVGIHRQGPTPPARSGKPRLASGAGEVRPPE